MTEPISDEDLAALRYEVSRDGSTSATAEMCGVLARLDAMTGCWLALCVALDEIEEEVNLVTEAPLEEEVSSVSHLIRIREICSSVAGFAGTRSAT